MKALAALGHRVTFLERETSWYRDHRDMPQAPYCRIEIYETLREVPQRYATLVRDADVVVLGSFVPDGTILGDWISRTARGVTAFYDIDTPVTLKRLRSGDAGYVRAALIPRFDLYLSFTGGPTLRLIEEMYGHPRVRPLYCAVDLERHRPVEAPHKWELGYLGTYSEDRQLLLDRLLLEPARRLPDRNFVVAGAQYPAGVCWPANVEHVVHLPPDAHPQFYCGQRYTLNLTRSDMANAGFSPSVRLFEAAACGVPVVSDSWPGIETFFVPEREILLAESAEEVLRILREIPESQRRQIASAARKRVREGHTAEHRARQFEQYIDEVRAQPRDQVRQPPRPLAKHPDVTRRDGMTSLARSNGGAAQ